MGITRIEAAEDRAEAAALLKQALAGLTGGAAALGEALLEEGMRRFPAYLDRFGDPAFRKERVRHLLGSGRWPEAEALAADGRDIASAGWHHILFARAYEQEGRIPEATEAWKAFDELHPKHPEAQAALIRHGLKPKPLPIVDPKEPLGPRMTDAECALFTRYLEKAKAVLEFGAGGSTALAGRLSVPHVVSVESDDAWLQMLARQPDLKGKTFVPVHVDIGTTGNWGFPADPTAAPRWPSYYSAIWSRLDREPDLVLIDGRFRVACALSSVLNVRLECLIVIHDFWTRPEYHVVLKYLTCIERADDIGIFRQQAHIDWKALARDLIAHAMDPR